MQPHQNNQAGLRHGCHETGQGGIFSADLRANDNDSDADDELTEKAHIYPNGARSCRRLTPIVFVSQPFVRTKSRMNCTNASTPSRGRAL